MSRKVLVVDDEKLIVKGIRFNLEQDGMEVDCAYDGEEAVEKAKENKYDIILLDLMLPKMDGLEVCQQIREFSNVPIVMLTAKGEDMDKILGLDYGADDYITKPFNILEVKARIKAIMRRARSEHEEKEKAKTIEAGDLKLDCESRRVFIAGKEINLTAKEFDVLELLVFNPNKVYSRENLLNIVWGYEYPGDVRTVDVHIRRLREKIEANPSEPKYVHTKWGVGYYFQAQPMVTKKKTKFFKSLRFRILVILIILGIVPSAIVTQLMISNYEKQAIEVKVSEVSTQCAILCNQIIKENYLNDSSSQSVNSKLELLSNVYGGRMVLVDRDLKVVADTYHVDEGRTLISPKVVKCFKNGEVTNYRRYGQMLEMAVPVKSADVPQIQGVMLVNISISDIMATVGAQEQMAMLIIGIIVALSALLAYGLSTILVKPLASVTKSIEDLTDGYQKDEISVPDYTETELITDAFNKMLARMKVLDESRSEFVSNVSHELKTPMTSMKVLADSLVGQEGVPEELYQEFMRDITAEIDRENRIITDLLTLVKMDKKSADLQISHMDINQLLEDILKRLRPIADKRNIDLILDSFRPVEADVDELKFTSAISNLVENAIKYNVDDGWVRVSLDADHKFFYVTVADSGMGIPEDSIDRIFERFYRVDKSHSREIGGTGLGLAITRSTIAMHHGVIKVFSREGEGTTFSVRVPLSYIP